MILCSEPNLARFIFCLVFIKTTAYKQSLNENKLIPHSNHERHVLFVPSLFSFFCCNLIHGLKYKSGSKSSNLEIIDLKKRPY